MIVWNGNKIDIIVVTATWHTCHSHYFAQANKQTTVKINGQKTQENHFVMTT